MSEFSIESLDQTDYFRRGGVSSSMLSVLYDECPAKLKAWLDGQQEAATPALSFGTLFHGYVLQPELLETAFHIKPADMSFATKEGKAWKAAHADRPIVKEDEVTATMGMVHALHRHKTFMRLFTGGESEQALFAMDENGTLRKGRLDRLNRKGNYVLDLKSCQSAKPSRFSKAINDYGYYRQAAFYLDLANRCNAGIKKETFIFAAVEKEPPYLVELYELAQDALGLGYDENERLLEIYRNCLKTGLWPAYSDSSQPPQEITLPGFREHQLEAFR